MKSSLDRLPLALGTRNPPASGLDMRPSWAGASTRTKCVRRGDGTLLRLRSDGSLLRLRAQRTAGRSGDDRTDCAAWLLHHTRDPCLCAGAGTGRVIAHKAATSSRTSADAARSFRPDPAVADQYTPQGRQRRSTTRIFRHPSRRPAGRSAAAAGAVGSRASAPVERREHGPLDAIRSARTNPGVTFSTGCGGYAIRRRLPRSRPPGPPGAGGRVIVAMSSAVGRDTCATREWPTGPLVAHHDLQAAVEPRVCAGSPARSRRRDRRRCAGSPR